jgi:pyruvate dehydrogenase E2 component (dihydrolipoamide acetyltransferase)
MPSKVIMPALGVAQEKGTLIHWLKAEGQTVAEGEPLMEVETDKATVEIEAPASGVLANVTAAPGDEVPVGQTIALIVGPGESVPKKTSPIPVTAVSDPSTKISAQTKIESGSQTAPTPIRSSSRVLASPAARRIARERGVDLTGLTGSGPEGSILTVDVLRVGKPTSPVSHDASRLGQVIPLSPMRRIVGERMVQSKQTAPHFYLEIDIDMTAVHAMRRELDAKAENTTPSINDFILLACARVLKQFPVLNASFSDDGIKLNPEINMGMAVALEDGLVVPVIRRADQLSLTALALQSRQLIEKTHGKKLLPVDYDGGTFTVSNLGMLGVDRFVAIINPPQCAILAVGRVAPRVVTDGDGIEIRSMMTVTLSADHRIADGAVGARFLQEVKRLLEGAHL